MRKGYLLSLPCLALATLCQCSTAEKKSPQKIQDRLAFHAAAPTHVKPSKSAKKKHPAHPRSVKPSKPRHHVRKKSVEWKHLPPQSWEDPDYFDINSSIDEYGFEKKNPFSFPKGNVGFTPSLLPSTGKIHPVGQIIGSSTDAHFVGLGDLVYIQTQDNLQIGQTYGITQEPQSLVSDDSHRDGYSYSILGSVKIVSAKSHVFIGRISSSHDPIERGSWLIPLPEKIHQIAPIPAPSAVNGMILFDHTRSAHTSSQQQEVFINRGSDDGIKPGMIFRSYEHEDPFLDKKIFSADYLVATDLLVTQVSSFFSSALVLQNLAPLRDLSPVTALTDISDVLKNPGFSDKGAKTDVLDDLDRQDKNDSLGHGEKQELQQLEDWKGNPPPPPPVPSASPAVEPSVTPPPSESPAAGEPSPAPLPGPSETPPAAEPTPTPSATATDAPPPPPPAEPAPAADAPPPSDIAPPNDAPPPPTDSVSPPPSDASPPPPPPAEPSS